MIDSVLDPTERRIVLVDGFNVLHAGLLNRAPEAGDRGEEGEPAVKAKVRVTHERETAWWRRDLRERLLRRAGRWVDPNDEIWVAFDGSDPSWSVWAEPVAIAGGDPRLASDRSAPHARTLATGAGRTGTGPDRCSADRARALRSLGRRLDRSPRASGASSRAHAGRQLGPKGRWTRPKRWM